MKSLATWLSIGSSPWTLPGAESESSHTGNQLAAFLEHQPSSAMELSRQSTVIHLLSTSPEVAGRGSLPITDNAPIIQYIPKGLKLCVRNQGLEKKMFRMCVFILLCPPAQRGSRCWLDWERTELIGRKQLWLDKEQCPRKAGSQEAFIWLEACPVAGSSTGGSGTHEWKCPERSFPQSWAVVAGCLEAPGAECKFHMDSDSVSWIFAACLEPGYCLAKSRSLINTW